jgi:uncharacterized protein (TIGR03435 family)
MKKILLTVTCLAVHVSLYGQVAQGDAKRFEVASVKPSEFPRIINMVRPMPGKTGVVAKAATLEGMIRWAYGLASNRQVVWNNKPKWSATGFDVDAKSTTDAGGKSGVQDVSQQDLEAMFQNLLAERFGLKIHLETQEMRVFLLIVENPAKLRYTEDQSGQLEQAPPNGTKPASVKGHGMTASRLCELLGYWAVSRPDLDLIPVIDKTGIERRLDFSLTWAPNVEGMKDPAGNPTPEFEGPTLFQALREQMGLKLGDGKAPMKVVVIDSAQMPTAN